MLAVPLLVVITAPFHASAPEWAHVRSAILPGHLWDTLRLLFGALAVAFAMAVPAAWVVANFDFPLRSVLRWALVLPLAMSTYIAAFTHAALFGPTGSISIWIHDHLGFRPDIMSLEGLWLVLGSVLFPYIYLPARAAFAQGMSTQLDAARTLGAGPWARFRRIALPLARPAIAGGALLVAMETLNDYGAVKYFGVRTLTTGIFRSWSGLYDLGSALRLSLVLLAVIAVLLWVEKRARRRAQQHTNHVPVTRVRLRGARAALVTGGCLLLLAFSLFLPVGHIIGDALGTWAEEPWGEVLQALGNTLLVAGLSGVVVVALAIAFAFRDRYRRRSDLAIRVARLGYAIPGAVIAVSVMAVAGAIDRQQWTIWVLIGSLGLIVYAFAVRFLAVGLSSLDSGLRQQSPNLDGSALLLGASPWRAFTRVNLPLLRPALVAAVMLVAIDVIKELPLTLILRPFNFSTLSTKAYEMANIEQLRQAAWPALLIIACGVLPVVLLERLMGPQGSRRAEEGSSQ